MKDLDKLMIGIEEYGLKQAEIAMIAIRMKKFYKKTGRRVRVDGKTPVGFDKKKLECFNCHNIGHFNRECTAKGTHGDHTEDERTNHALMESAQSSEGPQEPEPNESDDRSSEYSTCPSNDSAGSIGTSSKHSVDLESEISSVPPEVYMSTPKTTNEKGMSDPKSKEVEPSYVSYIKSPRQPIKDQATPKVNRNNWNAMVERELGEVQSLMNMVDRGDLLPLMPDDIRYNKWSLDINNMYSFDMKIPTTAKGCCLGIKQEYSNAKTPQQNRVAERMNKTLIEGARTMLADSLLPTTFWAEAVNKPNVKGVGYRWMFDIDYLTDSINYIPVSLENQANPHAGASKLKLTVRSLHKLFMVSNDA
ncbi:ribonuclease H-like domain-containing protein [Tanacetum coccineum]